jgi:hypothetical protein
MLFELLLNGTDRFLKLRDTEMEMVWHPAQAFRDRSILLSDAANRSQRRLDRFVRTPARITPYPTGRTFWGGALPGTSCQATIASSLRDISNKV